MKVWGGVRERWREKWRAVDLLPAPCSRGYNDEGGGGLAQPWLNSWL